MLLDFLIQTVDSSKESAIQATLDQKTKPPRSLGRIEDLAKQVASVQNTLNPEVDPACMILAAGDHGMVEQGVSAWPSEVTAQMVLNFLGGGAAANVFAKSAGIAIQVVDAGVKAELPDHPDLLRANINRGTKDAITQDAMSQAELDAILQYGAQLGASKVASGYKTILFGEMGIGNTSSATLLAHKLTNTPLKTLVGPGAGLDQTGMEKKLALLEQASARHSESMTPEQALLAYGGMEIALVTGAMIGAASKGAIGLVDGFIVTASALCAVEARPDIAPYMIYAHASAEPGHQSMCQALGAQPLLDLNLRLGEGTGALLAFPLLRSACAMMRDMATFESAGVSAKS